MPFKSQADVREYHREYRKGKRRVKGSATELAEKRRANKRAKQQREWFLANKEACRVRRRKQRAAARRKVGKGVAFEK